MEDGLLPDEVVRALQALGDAAASAAGELGGAATDASNAILSQLADLLGGFVKVGMSVASFGSGLLAANPNLFLLAVRTTNLSSAVYGAEKAFSSFVPTLDGVSEGLRNIINMGSGIRITGIAFTSLSNVLGKVSGLLKFQLEGSQKVADTFNQLTSQGLLFSGSIGALADSAVYSLVPMQTLAKVIQNNIENISLLGSSMETNARMVTNLSSAIFHATSGLTQVDNATMSLYGTYENLSEGVAGYLALLKQQGQNMRQENYTRTLTDGSMQEYLLRLKELSAFTGKNVKTLQKEEAERRQNLAYQLTLNAMGDRAEGVAQSFAMVENVAGKMGPEMQQIARAMFAGQELTAEQRQIAAMNQPAVDMIQRMVEASKNLDKDAFKTEFGKIGAEFAPILTNFARSMGDLARLPPGANKAIDTMIRISSLGLTSFSDLRNLSETVGEITGNTQDALRGIDPATKTFLEGSRTMMLSQMEIDRVVTDNMSKMSGLVNLLASLQTQIVRFQGQISSTIFSTLNRAGLTGDSSEAAALEALSAAVSEGLKLVTSSAEIKPPDMEGAVRRAEERYRALERRSGLSPATPENRVPTPTSTPVPNTPQAAQPGPAGATGTRSTPAGVVTPAESPPTSGPQSRLDDRLLTLAVNNFDRIVSALGEQKNILSDQVDRLDDLVRLQGRILDAVA
jgi:hypothetical protein